MNRKNLVTAAASVMAAGLAGLAVTGRKTGWGPFAGLYDWEKEVSNAEKRYDASERKGEIVFYGASNFRLWAKMEDDLKEYKVQNHGFGGSTDRLLVQYADRLLYPYAPAILFLQTGSNDYVKCRGTDAEKVNACMAYKKQMLETFHTQLPDAKIVILSGLLLPGRSEYAELTKDINRRLREYCNENDYLYFVSAEDLTCRNGSYRTELFVKDGIHLNHDGQLIWCEKYIRPMIEELIETYDLRNLRRKD